MALVEGPSGAGVALLVATRLAGRQMVLDPPGLIRIQALVEIEGEELGDIGADLPRPPADGAGSILRCRL